MQELPDDQLDGLFRKSLEESAPPYDPAAWPMMAEKLAVHDRQQFRYRWLRRVLPVAVLLVLPVSLWLLTRDKSSVGQNGKAQPIQVIAGSPATQSNARPSGRSVASGRAVADEIESAAPGTYEQGQSVDRRMTGIVPTVKRKRLQPPAPALAVGSSEPTNSEQSGEVVLVDGVLTEQPGSMTRTPLVSASRTTMRTVRVKRMRVGKPLSAGLLTPEPGSPMRVSRTPMGSKSEANGMASVVDRQVTAVEESPTDRFQLVIEPLRSLSFTTAGQLPTIDRPMVAPVADVQPAQLPAVNRDRTTGLSLRAMVSPDLSSVGLANFSRPGTNVGLLLEYQVQRWHMQAGVLRSVKVYQANESAYEYSAVRQWAVVPNSIDGRCNMLDIPINLRYDVALIPRQRALPPSRWFVSAGATTYYMLREDYSYKYDNPADPKIKYRDWTTETGRYGFSQLNLSGGYERAVTQRLFWQVEPFLKAPLKGVGYYKVNLLSTGVFFSLRYRL